LNNTNRNTKSRGNSQLQGGKGCGEGGRGDTGSKNLGIKTGRGIEYPEEKEKKELMENRIAFLVWVEGRSGARAEENAKTHPKRGTVKTNAGRKPLERSAKEWGGNFIVFGNQKMYKNQRKRKEKSNELEKIRRWGIVVINERKKLKNTNATKQKGGRKRGKKQVC